MNITIKTLCITLSLCVASAYAGDKQVGEHKGSESPRSSLSTLMGFQGGVKSLSSLGTVDPEDRNENTVVAMHRLHPGDEGYLSAEKRAHLKATTEEPKIVFGASQFPVEPFTGKKFVPSPFVQKKSWLSCLCCPCGKK